MNTPPPRSKIFAAAAIRKPPGIGKAAWNLTLCAWKNQGG